MLSLTLREPRGTVFAQNPVPKNRPSSDLKMREDLHMDRSQVAARFVAFVCYLNSKTAQPRSPHAAGAYARGNWKEFLPLVHEDLEELVSPSAGAWRDRPRAPRARKNQRSCAV
jgi:hypothetical protein